MQQNWKMTDHLVLAVSTGVDSMVLLHRLLHDYAATYRQLTCLHVHHGLRTASDEEAAFIQNYCEAHQIACYVKHLDLSEAVAQNRSIQNDARVMRYKWFDEMMMQLHADCLLTAHHQDDQIETIFYRLFTGKSTRNHLGISDVAHRQSYTVLRPLLNMTKAQIRAYQQQHDVPFFEDRSNASDSYVRNQIRNRLLPYIASNQQLQPQHLLRLKAFHDEALNLMEREVDAFITSFVTRNAHSTILERNAFNALTPHVKMLTLDRLLHEYEDSVTMSAHTYEDWFQKLASPIAQTELLHTNQWQADIVYDKLVIMAPLQPHHTLHTMQVTDAGHYRFGLYDVQLTATPDVALPLLRIRTRQQGDRVPWLHGHHKKVSRLMIDEKVPAYLRAQMPIVETMEGDILAVGPLFIQQKFRNVIKIQFMGDDIHGK
ncbi:tRNA lysidine(34) synthetase TilS [Staphylococcus lutrae]|uniref:tRNA(Ile)-lysidine synthase n=1 Tax=Staphylococcus lutrae TaxID=155085 RepID=A0AAC9RWA9_9STAP|nr:tRNA lysidine(34) synthetase TilS [Staphylococcus lutrae]ARJ51052.1 tRNA lysidine(34) synthetase TilS [Staphylococcus lutrae]PNZ38485.1 tRNA lysidine(34) synthetase TilS [Staphylococcus lutrae]